VSTLLTTKPDCTRRCSTLHSAHSPVRGQPGAFGVLSETLPAAELFTTFNAAVPEDESAPPEEEREQAARVAKASVRRERSLVIELER
jgi:hypothetical protein